MISDISFVFVVLPCIGAVIAGALLFDWRLAAAAACGAFGLLFVMPMLPEIIRVFGSSITGGIAVGATALVALLLYRPVASIWSRMTVAMIVAFAVHYTHLIYTVGRV